jgi:hypothetical protein
LRGELETFYNGGRLSEGLKRKIRGETGRPMETDKTQTILYQEELGDQKGKITSDKWRDFATGRKSLADFAGTGLRDPLT